MKGHSNWRTESMDKNTLTDVSRSQIVLHCDAESTAGGRNPEEETSAIVIEIVITHFQVYN